jgi:arylsulfatase B
MSKIRYALLPLLLLTTGAAYTQRQPPPNIIVIVADDLGWADVGFHGADIATPNIDRLAREGATLDRYYVAPICSPTRAGLMTGRYPERAGLRANVIPPWSTFGVDTTVAMLPVLLARAGYTNRAMIGKWHLGHARSAYLPLNRGFNYFYGHYNGAIDYFTHKREGELDWHRNEEPCYDTGYSTDLLAREAARCVERFAAAQKPFFIYLAFNAPHSPLQAPADELQAIGADTATASPRQKYTAMVRRMDKGIGKVLSALQQAGADRNTLVLFMSDNGAAPREGGSSGPLRGGKFTEWEGGVRAAAALRWPGGIKGGGKIAQVTGYIDVLPTLCDIAGIPADGAPRDGISIWPVLSGRKKAINRDFYLGMGALAQGSWKVIRANAGNPRMKAAEDQLFDLQADPGEKKNVRSAHTELYNKLLQKLKAYDTIRAAVTVPPYEAGRKGFKAPPEWKIEDL